MTTRELPPAEWDRLDGTELGPVRALLNPACTIVLVVEDDARAIVGCWAALLTVHAEGVWIAPDHRRHAAVQRRLWRAMGVAVKRWGASRFVTGAIDPVVTALLQKRGTALPPSFVVEVS